MQCTQHGAFRILVARVRSLEGYVSLCEVCVWPQIFDAALNSTRVRVGGVGRPPGHLNMFSSSAHLSAKMPDAGKSTPLLLMGRRRP